MSRDRALDALKRINDASQQTLERAADVAMRRSELGPATGFDTAGAPPIAELARLEDDSRRRLSPKRRLWGELGTFDERVAELDARHAAAQANLTAVRELLRGAPDKDTADLSRWIDNGEKGGRPIPTEPQLREQLSNAELEVAALQRAVSTELQRRSAFVEKHRDRLAGEAGRLAERAGEVYTAAINELAAARAELVDVRAAQLWALSYPSAVAGRLPEFGVIGCVLKRAYPHGMATITVDAALSLLNADAEALVTSMHPLMRAEITGANPRHAAAVWADDVTSTERQRETVRLIEAARREYGHEPTQLEVEAFARERAAGGV